MRRSILCLSLLLATTVHAQDSASYQFERPAGSAAASLRIITAQGRLIEQQYTSGQPVVFDARLADSLRRYIYGSGNSLEPGSAYAAFRGRAPTVEPLLRRSATLELDGRRPVDELATAIESLSTSAT